MKNMIKITKNIVLLIVSWVIIFVVLCSVQAKPLSGKVEIISEKITINKAPEKIDFLGILSDHYAIPYGYVVAAEAKFKTNFVTVKCNYDFLIKECESICKKKNYPAYAFVEVIRPNMITESCYHADIIFFARIKE